MAGFERKLYSALGVVGGLVLINLGFYFLALELVTAQNFSRIFADVGLAVSGMTLLFIGAYYGLRD